MGYREIVVGVDGSEPALAALRWAATEASRRRAPLRVLLAYRWRIPGLALGAGDELERTARDLADGTVDAAVTVARETAPNVDVTGTAVLGGPSPVLLAASHRDALVVVGSRGHSGISSTLLGSVSQQVAAHALGPVSVVRGRTGNRTGSVVVGVDGSAGSDQALGVAFDHADADGRTLVVVRAFTPSTLPRLDDPYPVHDDPAEAENRLRGELRSAVVPWREKYPDVVVEEHVVAGRPGTALVDFTRDATTAVVGSRGRGGFAGLLLGSVSQYLVHHSDCPVIVVHDSSIHPDRRQGHD